MGATVVLLLAAGRDAAGQAVTEPQQATSRATYVGFDVSHVSFQEDLDSWRFASVSLGRRSSGGSLIGRANYANRFGSSGGQVEIDAYPRLTSTTYAYLSAGYSPSDIFPTWRSGGEIFTSLPQGWEGSLGYRQLRFGGAPVTLLTGAAGKYVGNYWFSLRPYLRESRDGTSASASVTGRRYFADRDHFIGGRIGYGSAPPDQLTIDAAALTRMRSFSASAQGSGDIFGKILGTWVVGYEREKFAGSRTRQSVTAGTGLRVPL